MNCPWEPGTGYTGALTMYITVDSQSMVSANNALPITTM